MLNLQSCKYRVPFTRFPEACEVTIVEVNINQRYMQEKRLDPELYKLYDNAKESKWLSKDKYTITVTMMSDDLLCEFFFMYLNSEETSKDKLADIQTSASRLSRSLINTSDETNKVLDNLYDNIGDTAKMREIMNYFIGKKFNYALTNQSKGYGILEEVCEPC